MKSAESQFVPNRETPKVEPALETKKKRNSEEAELVIKPANLIEDKLQYLKEFKPSGNQDKDIEEFLQSTGREQYLKAVESGQIDPIALLYRLRDFQTKSLNRESKFHHTLNKDAPDFDRKHKFYREIPSLELKIIDLILQEQKTTEDKSETNKASDILTKNKLKSHDNETLFENKEKQERLKQISEQVEKDFELTKDRMLSIEQHYDEIFSMAVEKCSKLFKHHPNIISKELLARMNQNNRRSKEAFTRLFTIYDSGNNKLQSMLKSLSVEYLNRQRIESIKNSVDYIFETINREEEEIKRRIDNLESAIKHIPSWQEITQSAEKVQKIKKVLKESELTGKEVENPTTTTGI